MALAIAEAEDGEIFQRLHSYLLVCAHIPHGALRPEQEVTDRGHCKSEYLRTLIHVHARSSTLWLACERLLADDLALCELESLPVILKQCGIDFDLQIAESQVQGLTIQIPVDAQNQIPIVLQSDH